MIETDLGQGAVKIEPEGMPPIILRHSHPSKLDHAPKGTLCLVKNEEDGDVSLKKSKTKTGNTYRQMSDDESDPVWIEM